MSEAKQRTLNLTMSASAQSLPLDGRVLTPEMTAEALNTFRGPQGPKGDDGFIKFEKLTDEQKEMLRGPRGFDGPAGPVGPEGPQGPQGIPGKDAPQDAFTPSNPPTPEQVGALPSGGTAVNANALNGKSADQYALKTDLPTKASDIGALPSDGTAADSYKLDGKDSVYYHKKFSHPRNLLDNSDFRNPVNQRGETTYYGAGDRDVYTIDRWLFSWQAGAVLTVGKGYIQKNNLPLIQRLKNIDLNKTYTLALCFANGDKRVYSGTFANHFGDFDNFIWGGMAGDVPQVRIAPPVVDPLAWTALYEGEYTADNLPPYVPKGYAAELAECQRYYVQYDLYESFSPGKTFSSNAKLADIQFNVPCNFRASNLSIADYPDTCQVIVGTNGYMGSLVEGSVRARGNIVTMEFQSETDMPLNALCALRMIGKFALSADL